MNQDREKASLTDKQAFEAMIHFLELHYQRTKSDDLGALLGDLQLLKDGSTADPAAWQDWLQCVKGSRRT
jgi:hypothetical protein